MRALKTLLCVQMLSWCFLLSCFAHAANCKRLLSPVEQLAHQQIAENDFINFRDLRIYADKLSGLDEDFLSQLSFLTSKNVWLDGGSGEGQALRSYLAYGKPFDSLPTRSEKILNKIGQKSLRRKASVIGITFTNKPSFTGLTSGFEGLRPGLSWPADADGKMRELIDRRFEDIPLVEIGPVDLITDIAGIFSYSADPMSVLQKYLDLLSEGGKLYVFTPSVYVKGEYYDQELGRSVKNVTLPFAYWLNQRKIPGLQIQMGDARRAFSIRKIANKVKLPKLKIDQFDTTEVPFRKRLANPRTIPGGKIEFVKIFDFK